MEMETMNRFFFGAVAKNKSNFSAQSEFRINYSAADLQLEQIRMRKSK